MKMAKKVKKSQSKIKKKVWVKLVAPPAFGKADLGEASVEDPRQAIGKTVTANLMTLTRDPKKQGINVRFIVRKMHESHAETIFNRYRLMPASIKRMVRRNKNRLDHSFKCKTSDGVLLILKPIVLTMNKCNRSVIQALRKKVVSFLFYNVGKKTFDQFVQELITAKIQISLKRSLSKLYPVAICELREAIVSSYPDTMKGTKPEGKLTVKPAVEEKKPAVKPVKTEVKTEEKPAKVEEKPAAKTEEKPIAKVEEKPAKPVKKSVTSKKSKEE